MRDSNQCDTCGCSETVLNFIAECRQYLAARVKFASNLGDIGIQFEKHTGWG